MYNALYYMYNAVRFMYNALRYIYIALRNRVFSAMKKVSVGGVVKFLLMGNLVLPGIRLCRG